MQPPSERFDLERVEFHPAHRKPGSALVIHQMNGEPAGQQRRHTINGGFPWNCS
jgi:hypothetical protein